MRRIGQRGSAIVVAGLVTVFLMGCTSQPTTTPAPSPSAAEVPTPEPTAEATATPTASPTVAPSPTPSPSPTPVPTPAEAVVDDHVWVWKKPLSLTGGSGISRWTKVLFGAQTVDLRWTATPADASGCTLKYEVTSDLTKKPIKGSVKAKTAKAASAKKPMTTKYGDGTVSVDTDCAKWALKVVPTGHPGVKIKEVNSTFTATGTTATELNEALAKAWLPWTLGWTGVYRTGTPIRTLSLTPSLRLRYKLPKWTPPEGTDPILIDEWKQASTGMRRYLDGQAAMAVQAAGRFRNEALEKRTFPSPKAARRYYDTLRTRYSDQWTDRATDWGEATGFGTSLGAYIE